MNENYIEAYLSICGRGAPKNDRQNTRTWDLTTMRKLDVIKNGLLQGVSECIAWEELPDQ